MSSSGDDDKCLICDEKSDHGTATFVCKHWYCQQCIVKWYKTCKREGREPTCPYCRKVDNIWGT